MTCAMRRPGLSPVGERLPVPRLPDIFRTTADSADELGPACLDTADDQILAARTSLEAPCRLSPPASRPLAEHRGHRPQPQCFDSRLTRFSGLKAAVTGAGLRVSRRADIRKAVNQLEITSTLPIRESLTNTPAMPNPAARSEFSDNTGPLSNRRNI